MQNKCDSARFVWQLRYLQTLGSIAAENNSTIVFPVPIDIITKIFNQGNIFLAIYILLIHFPLILCKHVAIVACQVKGFYNNQREILHLQIIFYNNQEEISPPHTDYIHLRAS